MILLTATDRAVVLDSGQVSRIKHALMTFIPTSRPEVHAGPGVRVEVPNHERDELVSGTQAIVEQIIGCPVEVSELPG